MPLVNGGRRRVRRCRLLAEEAGHVAGDRGVGGVRQAEFLDPDPALYGRHLGARNGGQETLAEHLFDVAGEQGGFDGATDQAAALAQDGHRVFLRGGAGFEEFFLGDAAVGPERLVLAAIDLGAFFSETVGDDAGEREIDIIAAQQNVIADGDAVEAELAIRFGDGDQREIRGTAADIDDQDEVADGDAPAPIGVARSRRKGGLGFFEQVGNVLIAGLLGGLQGELARDGASKDAER